MFFFRTDEGKLINSNKVDLDMVFYILFMASKQLIRCQSMASFSKRFGTFIYDLEDST